MSARNYTSTATAKTVGGTGILAGVNELPVSPDKDSLPTVYPYTLVIDPDTAQEEIVTVRGLNAGNVLNITRGQDGTTDVDHDGGAIIKHMITPRDMQEPQNHIEAATAYTIKNDGNDIGVTGPNITKSLHGIASGEGAVVGTAKTQTLTNKTLTAPIITSPTISGTIAGAVVTSANIVDGTIVDADINASAAIAQSKVASLITDLGLKAPLANPTFTGTVAGITKSMVGLSNVDNTSDANKPISTATQTALDGKSGTAHGHAYLPTAGGTVTGNLVVNGSIYTPSSIVAFGDGNDSITFLDSADLYYLNKDGQSGTAGLVAGLGYFSNVQASGNITASSYITAGGYFYASGTIESPTHIRNQWVEMFDSGGIGYSRPMDDNDTQCGSSTRRWTRVFAVNTTISSSDERDKLDINDSPLGLDFINDLRPVAYRWKVGEKKVIIDQEGNPILDADGNKTYEIREGVRKHYGLISQEVKQAVDNSGVDDFAGWVQDDMSDPDSHQSISYEQFIAPLIKSVQELSAEVQTLKAKVAELEAK
jgi:hypothetical protein